MSVAISSLSDFPRVAKFLEQRIRQYSSASIPEGPAEPLVFKAESEICCLSINLKMPGGTRSTGPCRRHSSISAGKICFSFSWFITSLDSFNSPVEPSLSSIFIAAVIFA